MPNNLDSIILVSPLGKPYGRGMNKDLIKTILTIAKYVITALLGYLSNSIIN